MYSLPSASNRLVAWSEGAQVSRENIVSSSKVNIDKQFVWKAVPSACVFADSSLAVAISKANLVERLTSESLEKKSSASRLRCSEDLHTLFGKVI